MHIGFLIDAFTIGGTELNAVKVAESLRKQSVALTAFHFKESGPLRSRFENIGVELIRVPLHGFVSLSAARAIAQINREARLRKVQLIHSHCVYSNILAAAARRLSFRPIPLLTSRRWTGYAVRPELHSLNAFAQSASDAVLVNSPGLLRVVSEESPRSTPVYVPNMLPDQNFHIPTENERRLARTAVGLPQHGPIVGYVARLAAVKDHETLLRAWVTVRKEIPSATLAIIGDGPRREKLELLSRTLCLGGSVHFTGELPPESLPHSLLDVSVLTSSDEGFPNSLLEAMAQQVPIIATDVGGVSDLVTHSINGILVNKGDDANVAASILAVLTNTRLSQSLTTAALLTAETHREGLVTTELLHLYQSLISSVS